MTWTIYCHTHSDSGRRYVGLTKRSWQERWRGHIHGSVSGRIGTHFASAIRLYGKEAFSHEVLETCATLEEANAAEERWIAHFDTQNPEKGFNLARGGSHTPHPVKNPWDRPEFREANAGRNAHHLLRPESRERQLESMRSPASVARRSEQAKEALARPETRAKHDAIRSDPSYGARISASTRAALSDPEVRRGMSERALAMHADPEARARVLSAHAEAMASPEVRAKLSASSRRAWSDPDRMAGMTGRRLSEETRAKISAKSLGRRHTAESVEEQRRLYLERSSSCKFCGDPIEGKRSAVRGRVCCPPCRDLQSSGLVSFLRPDGSFLTP